MASSEEIKILINAEVGKAVANLKGLNSNLSETENSTNKAGASFKTFKKNLVGVGASFLGVGAALGTFIKSASDAQETTQKFDVIFGDVADSANHMARELASSYGLSSQESKKLLSNTGDLLTGMGMLPAVALDMSNATQQLAVDLASFTNLEGGAERASQALTSAMLGEREALKSLGISITEEMVKKEIATNIGGKYSDMTEREAKASAVLAIATKQSANAIGDFSRSQDSLANQTRIMQAGLKDVSAEIGRALIPAMNAIVSVIISVARWFNALNPSVKATILIVGGLAIAIALATKVVMAFGVSVGAALGPVTLIVVGIAAAIAIGKKFASAWGTIGIRLKIFWAQVKKGFNMIWGVLKVTALGMTFVWLKMLGALVTPFILAINNIIKGWNKLTGSNKSLMKNSVNYAAGAVKKQIALEKNRLKNAKKSNSEEKKLRKELADENDKIRQAELEKENAANMKKTESLKIHGESELSQAVSNEVAKDDAKNAIKEKRKEKELVEKEEKKASRQQSFEEELASSSNQERLIYAMKDAMSMSYEANKKKNNLAEAKQDSKKYNSFKSNFNGYAEFMKAGLNKKNKSEFIAYKAFAISQAVMATANAAMQGYAAMSMIPFVGPALGAVAAAAAVAVGARNVSKIASEQPPPKAFTGGIIKGSPSGMNVTMGERNQSEAIIPLDSDMGQKALGGGGGTIINVNIENNYSEDEDLPRMIAVKIDKALYDLDRNESSAFADGLAT